MILLTGASGFIGKRLLAALVKEYGSENILAFTSAPIIDCQYLLHNNYLFDKDYFEISGFADKIDTIIHAGAFIPKSSADANNIPGCNSNIVNTQKLLEASLPAVHKIIYLSTVDVYGTAEMLTENSRVSPVSLYGESKYYVEKMLAINGKERGRLIQILRVGHVYGPGEENYRKILPIAIEKLLNNEPIQIWGSGDEIRSFIYIDDLVTAIQNSVKAEKELGIVNLAGTVRISIRDLVHKLLAISGKKVPVEHIATAVKGRDLLFDNSKMKNTLLNNELSLDAGLLEEWKYMKSFSQ